MSRTVLAFALLAGGLLAAPAQAAMIDFHATMSGAAEVPPTNSPGTGDVLATLDTVTKTLSYTVTYMGLATPVVGAHFHAPAAAGANAGVVVPLKPPASPIVGHVKLTDAQVADLMAGKWYANVHTKAHPTGAIRGQLTR